MITTDGRPRDAARFRLPSSADMPISSTRALLAFLLASALLGGCGGASTTTTTTTTTGEGTSGDELPPEAAHAIRTTTPIPVPQPAIAREEMSPELQQLWELVETAIALRPPEPPEGASLETVNAWAEGELAAWLTRRLEASTAVQDALAPLEGQPAHERGVAAGLYAYLQESTVADVRGAPIPVSIATDAELLHVYDESMLAALLPYARVALQAYRFCDAAFSEGEDPAWEEWAAYCRARGEEVGRVYAIDQSPSAFEPTSEQPISEEESE